VMAESDLHKLFSKTFFKNKFAPGRTIFSF
jgi:hypothetical protein